MSQANGHESAEVGQRKEDAWPEGAPRRITLITGASGGIGADLARVFARHGHDLALVVRSRDGLEALADEIAATGRPRPLVAPADLTGEAAPGEIAVILAAGGASPDILVNNAGFGLLGEARKLDAGEQLEIADLNIRAAMAMTLRFLPDILAARGKILNVASIAGYFPGGPGMAAYYASKAFLLSYSQDGIPAQSGDRAARWPCVDARRHRNGGGRGGLQGADGRAAGDRARIFE